MLIFIEIAAVLFTFLYLYFIGKKQAFGWLMGILASVLSLFFFYIKGYYGSAVLNFVYIFQGLVGFLYWKKLAIEKPVKYYFKLTDHFFLLAIITLLYLVLRWILNQLGIKDLKNIDIILSCGCIVATYLEIKKDTSCWWYWMVLNIFFSMYYFNGNMPIYAGLMVVLAVFSYWALRQWNKKSVLN